MDALAFLIEAEERGLLYELPPRIVLTSGLPLKDALADKRFGTFTGARRGKKAARAKRQRAAN